MYVVNYIHYQHWGYLQEKNNSGGDYFQEKITMNSDKTPVLSPGSTKDTVITFGVVGS